MGKSKPARPKGPKWPEPNWATGGGFRPAPGSLAEEQELAELDYQREGSGRSRVGQAEENALARKYYK